MDFKTFAAVFGTVFLAELGDKTQLATVLFAAKGTVSLWTIFGAAAAALVLDVGDRRRGRSRGVAVSEPEIPILRGRHRLHRHRRVDALPSAMSRARCRSRAPNKSGDARLSEYAAAVNDYVARGLERGCNAAGAQPAEPSLEHLVPAALAAVREANSRGAYDELREQWPPAYEPFGPRLQRSGQSIPVLCILDDGSIVLRLGAPYESGRTVRIIGDRVVDLPHVGFFGRSPDLDLFAVARPEGVQIVRGWGGPQLAMCPWPTGCEDLPEGIRIPALKQPPLPERLIPFPDGQRVLLVSGDGVFVLTPERAHRLLPTTDMLIDAVEHDDKSLASDGLARSTDMAHGAVSRDGRRIVVGEQIGSHRIFDGELRLIGRVGTRSEYAHYALFSADERVLALNSCHFYNGVTIGVPMDEALVSEEEFVDSRLPTLQDGARVYSGVACNDEFIIGDAYGYLRAFSTAGDYRGQHFIGSTVQAMDLSRDGHTLVAATFAGFVSIIDPDAGVQAPHQIGNANYLETRRWLFWRDEPQPLIW